MKQIFIGGYSFFAIINIITIVVAFIKFNKIRKQHEKNNIQRYIEFASNGSFNYNFVIRSEIMSNILTSSILSVVIYKSSESSYNILNMVLLILIFIKSIVVCTIIFIRGIH